MLASVSPYDSGTCLIQKSPQIKFADIVLSSTLPTIRHVRRPERREPTRSITSTHRCGIITRCSTSYQNAGTVHATPANRATPMRHHHEMLDIPSERWQPYCHPRPQRPPEALAPYCYPHATQRPPKSMPTSTRDVRHHRILVGAYNKRSYGDDTKLTTNSTHQPHLKTINRQSKEMGQ